MPLVSVVIPAHNPGSYLVETLESLISQSLVEWEAVVVDDGSVQDLRWVASVDPRVRLLRQRSKGASAARNAGILATSSELVAFLDADDLWLPDKLASQVEVMRSRWDLGFVSTQFVIIDAAGVVTGEGYGGHDGTYESLLSGNGVCTSTVMARRAVLEHLGCFDASLTFVHDWDLWLRIAQHSPIAHVGEVHARYRVHSGGLSRAWRQTHDEALRLLARHPGAESAGGPSRVRELAAFQALDHAREARAKSRYLDAVRALSFVAHAKPSLLVAAARQVSSR